MRHIGKIAAELRRANGAELTKKAIVESLRGVDGIRANQATEMVPAIQREAINQAKRIALRAGRRRGPLPIWERGTLEQRLLGFISSSFPRQMRKGDGTHAITTTTDPAKVGYTVMIEQEWKKYGRMGYKKHAVDTHNVVLPHAYMSRVWRRGLAVVDGMPTLDAAKLDAPEGVELFAARWARQGRGYIVEVDAGYIARSGRHTYHAASVEAALRGLRRKSDGVKLAGPTMARLAEMHGGQWVPLAAVRAVGACDYGVRSWIERTGMRPQFEAGGATVAEIAAGYAICPAPEARAAVLYALRQAKKAA